MRHFLMFASLAAGCLSSAGAQGVTGVTPTRYALSRDGTRIAYDVSGDSGKPAIMLLHGGGQTRSVWHRRGYVDRLKDEFRVITVDQRGNGESDKPTDVHAYEIERLIADLTAVADSAGARTFALWGFSYGANIGRYLATRTQRVESMVYIGIPFGPAVSGPFLTFANDMRAKWRPHIEAHKAGRLDVSTLSAEDRAAWMRGPLPLTFAWVSAMLDYPSVEPPHMRVPTLWVVGSANAGAMESVAAYRDKLAGSRVTLQIFDGLNHPQELDRIDVVLQRQVEFTHAARPR